MGPLFTQCWGLWNFLPIDLYALEVWNCGKVQADITDCAIGQFD